MPFCLFSQKGPVGTEPSTMPDVWTHVSCIHASG